MKVLSSTSKKTVPAQTRLFKLAQNAQFAYFLFLKTKL